MLGMGRQPGALTLSEDDRRVLASWAADCAERTLWLFEAQAPNDTRPRMPSTACERSPVARCGSEGSGPWRRGHTRRLGKSVTRPQWPWPGSAVQAASVAHMAAHARGVAYAAKAAGLAAPDDPAAVAREVGWQLRHASGGCWRTLEG
jgi:hypothetical protein